MAITPQTNIQILQCPLTEDQENQLTFSSVAKQNEYFEGLPKISVQNCTYQRKENIIRFEGHVDDLQMYNYVRYQNKQFSNKWFYAFITNMEYVNENMTFIHIKTDVYQTWCFDFELQTSFVEREHVSDDYPGVHTVSEGLEYGNYVINHTNNFNFSDRINTMLCMQVTDFPDNAGIDRDSLPNRLYGNIPSGCYYVCIPSDRYNGIDTWINAYVKDGKQDAIIAIFPLPFEFLQARTWQDAPQLTNNIFSPTYLVPKTLSSTRFDVLAKINLPNGFQSYEPKNKKLYSAPYCYFYFNTNTGSSIEYHFEDFVGLPQFRVDGNVSAGGEYKVYPINMKNQSGDYGAYAYGIKLSSLPLGSWNTDFFNNWKALNSDAISIQNDITLTEGVMQGAGQLMDLNLMGTAMTAVSTYQKIKLANNQIEVAKKLPDQARGDTATQSLTYSLNLSDGTFYVMTIKAEYAMMIDDYFTMYGYKVNQVKVPFINTRKNHNYVKTIGCNIIGNLPQDDLIEIKQIFDRGCTFWHNPQTFLNYHADNSII